MTYVYKMNIQNLSLAERCYLVGLYFADGCIMKCAKSTYRLVISLQGGENDIADRVMDFFRRLELSPKISFRKQSKTIDVNVICKDLISLFPKKKKVKSLNHDSLKWVRSEGLEIPFIGGLLDGDGYISASCSKIDRRRRSIFGGLYVRWMFTQAKYPFLAQFVDEYVNGLVRDGASLRYEENGALTVSILAAGRSVLLQNGISKWSLKISKFLERAKEIQRDIGALKSEFLTAHQVAGKLHINDNTIRTLCRQGKIAHITIRSIDAKKKNYLLIPIEEVDRLQNEITRLEQKNRAIVSSRDYLSVKEVSCVLGVARSRVQEYCGNGQLKAISLATIAGWRKNFIPVDEVRRFPYNRRSEISKTSSSQT